MNDSKGPLTKKDEEIKGNTLTHERVYYPQQQQQQQKFPITKSSGGIGTKICIRATLSACVCGVVVGFCLLVAGGVRMNQLANIKVLMYIGILMFLVCVILLVILCSSYDIFNIHPLLEATRQKPQCLCNLPLFETDINGCTNNIPFPYVQYPTPKGQLQVQLHQTIPQFYQPHGNKCGKVSSIPPGLSIQNDVITLNPIRNDALNVQKEVSNCTVKNCVCLVKNVEGVVSEKEDLRQSNTFGVNNGVIPMSSLCYHGNRQHGGGNPFYAIQANYPGLPGNRVPSTVIDNFPLQMYNPYREDWSTGTKESKYEKTEDSSRL